MDVSSNKLFMFAIFLCNYSHVIGTPCLSSASFSGPPVLAAPLTRSSDASIASIPLHELHTTMAVQPSSTTQQQVIRYFIYFSVVIRWQTI